MSILILIFMLAASIMYTAHLFKRQKFILAVMCMLMTTYQFAYVLKCISDFLVDEDFGDEA